MHVRHRSRDLDILTEVFGRGTYTPPPGVAETLAGPVRVTDAGGNIGLFGLYALQQWNVTVLRSYEPDRDNARLLTETARPFGQWDVIRSAVSNHAGTIAFRDGLLSESRAALPGEESTTVPAVDLFTEPASDLLKLDIEGGEWALLGDSRLPKLQARVVVLEWHRLGCPDSDPGAYASRLLREAGYTGQARGEACASNGMLWAWRAH